MLFSLGAMAQALAELDGAYGGIEPHLQGPCGITAETITLLGVDLMT
jgi:hypothetical protein